MRCAELGTPSMAPHSRALAALAACVLVLSPIRCEVNPPSNASVVSTFADVDAYSAATKSTGTDGRASSAAGGATQLFILFVDLRDAPSEERAETLHTHSARDMPHGHARHEPMSMWSTVGCRNSIRHSQNGDSTL